MKYKVKYYRQKLGITQKELAEKVGVSRRTINSLENGKYSPSLILAYKITIALGMENIHEIFILDENDIKEKEIKDKHKAITIDINKNKQINS